MKKSKTPFLLEVCVDSAESAIAAQAGGAARVELCDNLLEGGTTPSAGTIELARKHLNIAMNVIIRPRGGDFDYSDLEFEIMQRDIQVARERGADGVVIGILKPNGTIDKTRTCRLIALARPMSVTFHKAFDVTRDPFEALDTLIEVGVDRVLTSGQEASVIEGLGVVKELQPPAPDGEPARLCAGRARALPPWRPAARPGRKCRARSRRKFAS